jgi:hypothetical protein
MSRVHRSLEAVARSPKLLSLLKRIVHEGASRSTTSSSSGVAASNSTSDANMPAAMRSGVALRVTPRKTRSFAITVGEARNLK